VALRVLPPCRRRVARRPARGPPAAASRAHPAARGAGAARGLNLVGSPRAVGCSLAGACKPCAPSSRSSPAARRRPLLPCLPPSNRQAQDRYLKCLAVDILGGAHSSVVSAGRPSTRPRPAGAQSWEQGPPRHISSLALPLGLPLAPPAQPNPPPHPTPQVRMLQQADMFRDPANMALWAHRVRKQRGRGLAVAGPAVWGTALPTLQPRADH
jgi:hypothetical protein